MSAKPWLENHKIAKPCSVKWTDMSGDERKRFCGKCRLNVYNLSAMTGDEAENLLARNSGKVCTYFYQRSDGTVLTQDCPVGLAQTFRTRGVIAAAVYALSLLFSMPASRADQSNEPHAGALMGGIAATPVRPQMGEPPVAFPS